MGLKLPDTFPAPEPVPALIVRIHPRAPPQRARSVLERLRKLSGGPVILPRLLDPAKKDNRPTIG